MQKLCHQILLQLSSCLTGFRTASTPSLLTRYVCLIMFLDSLFLPIQILLRGFNQRYVNAIEARIHHDIHFFATASHNRVHSLYEFYYPAGATSGAGNTLTVSAFPEVDELRIMAHRYFNEKQV